MKTSLISFIVLSLMFYGCVKNDICGEPAPRGVLANLDSLGLPPATTTGENTFGCLINGEPWLPLRRNIFDNLYYDVSFTFSDDGALELINRQDYDGFRSSLSTYWVDILSDGVFSSENFIDGSPYFDFDDMYPGYDYYTISTHFLNKLEINRLDFEEQIISGTFEGVYIEDEVSDTLYITEGRFDLKGY